MVPGSCLYCLYIGLTTSPGTRPPLVSFSSLVAQVKKTKSLTHLISISYTIMATPQIITTEQTTVPGRWIVRVKPYLTSELVKKEHLSLLAEKTEDPLTPFNVDIIQQFDLDDPKGYSAKFDDTTKEELETIPQVSEQGQTWSVRR